MSFRQLVAKNVRRLRKQYGWTQQQLAERMGCHKQTIWSIEAGRTGISDRLMDQLVAALDVSFTELIRLPPTPEDGGGPRNNGGASRFPQSDLKRRPSDRRHDAEEGEQGLEANWSGNAWPTSPEEVLALVRRAAQEGVQEAMREHRFKRSDQAD